MFLIIGAVIVLASVIGGFVMVGGQLLALWHVNEIIVICGSALGAWIIGLGYGVTNPAASHLLTRAAIKRNMNLEKTEADINDSKTVVRICTEYAQSGMWNIFIALMTVTLAFALFNPNFFVALAATADGKFLPQTGAVVIKDAQGEVIGAVGASGGTGDEDEAICIAGVQAAGLAAG